jgi:Tol biopolymer transport system component
MITLKDGVSEMKHLLFLLIGLIQFETLYAQANQTAAPEFFRSISGDYLGQIKPSLEPSLFAPGIISTNMNEFNATFSKDGSEFYFSVRDRWNLMIIFITKKMDNRWTRPEIVSFSGTYLDADPFIAADGKRLFFCSNRPVCDTDSTPDWNIWTVERSEGQWTEPRLLPFNTEKNEMYVSVSLNGNIYFHADYEGKRQPVDISRTDLYYSEYNEGTYNPPRKLSDAVNSVHAEWDPFIAPDESYIIFTSPRPGGYGSGDLYISFRERNEWLPAINMGRSVNTAGQDYCPNISPDGSFLFFTSYRIEPISKPVESYDSLVHYFNGPQTGSGGDIYWVDIGIIENLRESM